MLTLYQTPSAWGVPNISPFCMKLESYLRMTGIPYQTKMADMRQAPKGKVPYVEMDGALLGDSQLVIEHLKRKHGDPLDKELTPQQVALGHTVRRMLEEATYFPLLYVRWVPDEAWNLYRPVFKPLLPPVIDGLLLKIIRRGAIKNMYAQGTSRHTDKEVQEMAMADVWALSTLLGDNPYLLGPNPTSFDATVYAFIEALLSFPADSALKRHTQAQDNLVRYCERFRARYFPNNP